MSDCVTDQSLCVSGCKVMRESLTHFKVSFSPVPQLELLEGTKKYFGMD